MWLLIRKILLRLSVTCLLDDFYGFFCDLDGILVQRGGCFGILLVLCKSVCYCWGCRFLIRYVSDYMSFGVLGGGRVKRSSVYIHCWGLSLRGCTW